MKEADLGSSLEAFVINHVPSWGIRLKYPNSPNEIIPIGDEDMTDIILQYGVSRTPPKNNTGEYAISAKKVKIE
jgi:hypothetical protein